MAATESCLTGIPHVYNDRVIKEMPDSCLPFATPYKNHCFSDSVKLACKEKRISSLSSLRVCKVVLVGDVGVGKTSFVQRFCHSTFHQDYKATIGVDFEVEKFSILGVPFTLQIWDTAGQERFRCIAASYYRGADVLVVSVDLSEPSTFHSCRRWTSDALIAMNDPLIFLVALKRDLLDDDQYAQLEEKLIILGKELGAELWIASSKSGLNIKTTFFRISSLVFERIILQDIRKGEQRSIGVIGGYDLVRPSSHKGACVKPELLNLKSELMRNCC